MSDATGTPTGLQGVLWLTGSSVTLPIFVPSIFAPGTWWDIESLAAKATGLSGTEGVTIGTMFAGGASLDASFELAMGISTTNPYNANFVP